MPDTISRRRFVGRSIRLVLVTELVALDARPTAAQPAARAWRFGASERRTLRAAADLLIPPDGRMPSASAVGAVGYIERAAASDSALRRLLGNGLRALDARARGSSGVPFARLDPERQKAVLAGAEKDPETAEGFSALRDFVYEAYYTQPKVWKLLGYSFRSGRRPTARLEPFDESWVARVRGTGRSYRQVPE